jgi:hypothetical protein
MGAATIADTMSSTARAPGTPPGWSYNPSAWAERLAIVGLALVGFAIAAYLAAYQYGLIASVWEPFFGRGSARILHSWISDHLPVRDAALGAFAYLIDAATGVVGGRARWRTKPWVVLVFGTFVGPLGAVSLVLVILQPVLFHAWCTLCLASAAISVLMIGPAMDEVLASLQHLARVKRSGGSAWRAFLGRDEGPGTPDPREVPDSCGPAW